MLKNIMLYIVLIFVSLCAFCPQQAQAQQLLGPARLDLAFDATSYTTTDVNKDGLADIVTVTEGGKITLHLGQVFGGYMSQEIYDGSWYLYSKYAWFFTTDCNNDNSIDLLFVESDQYTLNVFFGDGLGHFSAPVITKLTDFGFSEESYPACAGDVNRDGYADMVFQDIEPHGTFPNFEYHTFIILGSGNGTFSVSDTLVEKVLSYKFNACVIEDFNEDGNSDIAILRSPGQYIDSMYVYTGDGQGKFTLHSKWGIGIETQHLLSGDFNNDGHKDVISGNMSFEAGYWESINVRLGDGTCAFPIQRSTALSEKLWQTAVGDFDGDRTLDLAFISHDKGLGVAFGVGDGTFARIRYLNAALWSSLHILDINGDTFPDIMFNTYGGVSQLFNDRTGSFETAPQFSYDLPVCAATVQPCAFAADIDKNNTIDLLVTNSCSDALAIVRGQGDGTFAAAVDKITLPGSLAAVAFADMNSDGRPDLIGAELNNPSILIMPAKESGGFAEIRQQGVAVAPGKIIDGNFNGDSHNDIAFLTRDKYKIVIMFGADDGSFSASSEITLADSVADFCAADFNKDTRLDLAVYDYFSPSLTPLHFYKGDGSGGFTEEKSLPGMIGANSMAAVDVNHDGCQDIVVVGLLSALVHQGDGTGNFSMVENQELGLLGQLTGVLVMDLNLDGNADLAISDFSELTHHVKIFPGNGDGTFLPSTINYGVSNIAGTLCAADFDNDGAADIAVVHPDTNLISILSSPVRLEHDIAVKAILAPEKSIVAGTAVAPRTSVFNRGTSAEMFQLTCEIGDIYLETVDVQLNAGEQKDIEFPEWIAQHAGKYGITITAVLADDQIHSNNTLSSTVLVTTSGDNNLTIYNVSPDYGGNEGWLSVMIFGAQFDENTKIKLVRNGREIPATGYSDEQSGLIDSTKIKAVFDLNGAEAGEWDVVVENSDGSSFTFKNGLYIEAAQKTLWVDILGQSRFALTAHHPTYLSYDAMIGNSGNTNLQYAVMVLDIPKWLDLCSIVKVSTGDTVLLGDTEYLYNIINGEKRDSIKVEDIDSTNIAFYIGVLNPNEVVTFKVNVVGNWAEYRDLDKKTPLKKEYRPSDDDGGGIGISGFLMDGVKCFGKNLAENVADRGDVTLQDFEDAGEKTLESMGEKLFWSGVTITIEILCPWTIPFIEAYNIASKLIGSIKDAEQMFKLAMKFLLLFAEWWGDPNFKEGPVGYGPEGYITDNRPYFYQVHFENDSAATAPPPCVIVRDTLDSDLDWSTFENIGSSHPLTNTTLDTVTGEVVWTFEGIDLPPNKIPPEGEAWLSYSIRAKSALSSGTVISNGASIVFAGQDTIKTNRVVNTIDNKPPTAQMESLASTQNHVAFTVKWDGSDSESGIYLYNIYVAENGGAFKVWKQTEKTRDVFIGKNGTTYSFYCTAIDNVGHISAAPSVAEAMTTVKAEEDIGVNPNPFVPSRGHDKITFFGGNVANAEIKIFNKAGRLVATLRETRGEPTLDWNATNDDGAELASGVYIWVITGKDDSKNKGKFAIIR